MLFRSLSSEMPWREEILELMEGTLRGEVDARLVSDPDLLTVGVGGTEVLLGCGGVSFFIREEREGYRGIRPSTPPR